jgi:hypothetical protein
MHLISEVKRKCSLNGIRIFDPGCVDNVLFASTDPILNHLSHTEQPQESRFTGASVQVQTQVHTAHTDGRIQP